MVPAGTFHLIKSRVASFEVDFLFCCTFLWSRVPRTGALELGLDGTVTEAAETAVLASLAKQHGAVGADVNI